MGICIYIIIYLSKGEKISPRFFFKIKFNNKKKSNNLIRGRFFEQMPGTQLYFFFAREREREKKKTKNKMTHI